MNREGRMMSSIRRYDSEEYKSAFAVRKADIMGGDEEDGEDC